MKFTCRKSILGEILSVITKIPNPKTNLEVLKGTLFEVKDGNLILYRTNLDTSLLKSIPVKEGVDGQCVVDGIRLGQYIQTLDEKNSVECTVMEGSLVIKSEQGEVSFGLLDLTEFPTPVQLSTDSEVFIDTEAFIHGLQSTVFACAKSAIRPEFASVYVHQKKGEKEIVFVATDSFRLSEVTEPYEFNEFKDFLIPAPVAQNVLKVLQGFEGDIAMSFVDGQLVIKKDGYEVVSRLTEAEFPPYERIIPSDFQYQIQILKKDLISIFRQVQIFSDTYNQVSLTLSKEGLVLTSGNQQGEGGEHKITASLEKVDSSAPDTVELKFNYMYFLEALQHVPGDTVVVLVAGPQKPLLIQDEKKKGYRALVMPMSK